MRRLILIGAIGLAFPAFAAEDSAPAVKTPAAEAAPAAGESTAGEEKSAPTSASESASSEPATKMGTSDGAPAGQPEGAGTASAEPALPPLSSDALARGTFATAIDQREPVDSITSLASDRDRVYYFSEFVGSDGRRVTHRWEYAGEIVAEVPIAIGGPRWRAYSSKNLDSSWLGEWTVSVIDETGNVVHTDTFVYEAAPPEPEVAATPTKPSTPKPTDAAAAKADAAPSDEEPASSPAAPAPGSASAEPGAETANEQP